MKTIDVVAAIIEQQDKILLAQRDETRDHAGLWEFPGGKVEPGESQPEALMRELREELNIEATIGRFIGSSEWRNNNTLIRLHAWQVTDFLGEPEAHCHSVFVWVEPEQAAKFSLAPADIPLLNIYRSQCPNDAQFNPQASNDTDPPELFAQALPD